MSNRSNLPQTVSMVLTSVFLGLIALFFGAIFLLFFVPVVVYYLWSLNARVRELERRLLPKERVGDTTAP
jgi:RsiW-degrading membrane proteinase PrsW (M82 family)